MLGIDQWDFLNVEASRRVRRINGLKDQGEANIGGNLLFELIVGHSCGCVHSAFGAKKGVIIST